MNKQEETNARDKIIEIYRFIVKNSPYNVKLTITNDKNAKQHIKGVIKYE